MRELTQILSDISDCIDQLEVKTIGFTRERSEILDRLSYNYYWLTEHRDVAHKKWMACYFGSSEKSATGKEKEADNKVPELYTIRHFMSSTKLVIDSLRTSISANK